MEILTSDAYRGFSASIQEKSVHAGPGAQPIYVGRVVWPGKIEAEDVVIKLYEAESCGPANEAIGYIANSVRGIAQPRKSAILLLPKEALPPFECDLTPFIDKATEMAVCWITSYEQNTTPFHYLRRLSSFADNQVKAFYKSRFCLTVTGIDHITGNNDRHEGNILYIDDLHYLAIDQGSVGGSTFWTKTWPDQNARNELLLLVQKNLSSSQLATWHSHALIEYETTKDVWNEIVSRLSQSLPGLLTPEQIDTIISYMDERVHGNKFQVACDSII